MTGTYQALTGPQAPNPDLGTTFLSFLLADDP
jgi:hypothetical protein